PRLTRALVAALMLLAVASSRSQAQSDTGLALPNPVHRTSAAAGPIVVPPAQRAPQPSSPRDNGGGPIVVPQTATPVMNAPANGNRGQPSATEAMPNPPSRTNLESSPNMAAGFREPAALDALYGATHFRGTSFFGAPKAGMLTGACGANRNGREPANTAD